MNPFPLLVSVIVVGLALTSLPSGPVVTASPRARIEWDETTRVRIQSGTYGRMIRLRNRTILCSFEAGGKSWVSPSRDNGRTWGEPVLAKALPRANAANPELLQLKSGRILLFFNQRPHTEKDPFAIGYSFSDDGGKTWHPGKDLLYRAGQQFKDGCWEPAAVQLPSGEIQLFFANEFPYPNSGDQEITLMRSFDDGASWSAPETVSYRAGHRDGMPVPLLLKGNKGIVLAIEDSGLAPGRMLQPAIVFTPRRVNWRQPVVKGDSPRRWGALKPPLPGSVYAGAPYLRQFPSGETVLSCQSTEGGRKKPQMVVYLGDASAKNFGSRSVPFEIPGDVGGMWNALFIKDARTVTAISETVIDGVHGLWALDGRLITPGKDPKG
ncbi:MAG: glycoside hydrolase [Armatimonadetes bacterium]|nr:glycoside hydrolase [Armatimonadota bacterium]